MKLNFKFVDRGVQRRELAAYFKGKPLREQGIWISGPHNVGKTALINEVKRSVEGRYIHVITDEYPYNYLEYLLAHISDIEVFGTNSFLYYISAQKPQIDSFLTTKYGKYHILYQEKRLELAHLLCEEVYSKNIQELIDDIQSFSKKNNIQGIIFDDFENCDLKSLMVLQFFIAHIVEQHISLCFITDSDKKLSDHLAKFLFENLDIRDYQIGAFDDIFFYEEFINSCTSIPTDAFTTSQINRIYDITKGKPGELRLFMNVLRASGAFNQSDIARTATIDLVLSDAEKTSYILPTASYAKDILIVMCIFQTPIRLQLLFDLFEELYRQSGIIHNLLTGKIVNLIDSMQDDGLLSVHDNQMVGFQTKSIRQRLYESIMNSDKARFYFILNNLMKLCDQSWFVNHGCRPITQKRIQAFCQLIQKAKGFVKSNFELARQLFNDGNYSEVLIVFERIQANANHLTSDEIMEASDCLYYIGAYKLSLHFINTVNYELLSEKQKVRFLILRGKLKFILLDPECATDFENAQYINNQLDNIPVKIEICNLLFMAYSENKHTLERARTEFLSAIAIKTTCISYAKLCRNAHNVLPYDEAVNIMIHGLAIARQCKDALEIAKCSHNIAFIKLMYIEDIENLEELKTIFKNIALFFQQNNMAHESAYSLNDYAVILMLQGKWDEASYYLRKARVLTNSLYALNVINCNLLLASCFPDIMSHTDMTERLQTQYAKIKQQNIVDNRILRKHLINFAIIALRYDDTYAAKFYLNECRELLDNSPSAARFNTICHSVNEPICAKSPDIGKAKLYYRDFSFEPWILSFGHD